MTDTALPQIVVQLTQAQDKLAALEQLVGELKTALGGQAGQAARLQAAEEALAALTAKIAEVLPDEHGTARAYQPRPAPRWWNLTGPGREAEIGRLRGWVEQVYRPGTGTWPPGCGPAGRTTSCACTAWTSPPSCTPCSTCNPGAPCRC